MSHVVDTPPEGAEPKRRSPLAEFFIRLVREKPLGTVGGVIVLVLLLAGIFSPFLATHDVHQAVFRNRDLPPSAEHLLGTDHLGRDIYSRIIFGARISLIIGLAASTLNAVTATLIGIISGFLGGKTDIVTQRFVDAFIAFPGLLLLLTVLPLTGRGLLQIIVVLGLMFGIRNSRVMRSAVIGI